MDGLKESKQAVGAEVLAGVQNFAPPTILAQASRLNFSTRLFNLIVTNVPGPQFPLYVRGREMLDVFPVAFLPKGHALADRDHVLQRRDELRPARRLRRAAGPRRASATASRPSLAELAARSAAQGGARRAGQPPATTARRARRGRRAGLGGGSRLPALSTAIVRTRSGGRCALDAQPRSASCAAIALARLAARRSSGRARSARRPRRRRRRRAGRCRASAA